MRSYTTPTTIVTSLLILSLLFILFHSPSYLPKTTTMSSYTPSPQNDAALNWLHVTLNPNGSLTRPKEFYPTIPPSSSTSKDILLNPNTHTHIRLYIPNPHPNPNSKLPIFVFIHGGGFVLCSTGTPAVHHFCEAAARDLHALVVSVDYRLAPEHRLPAAYDDVLEALTWVKDAKYEWIKEYGDLSRCVIGGESAGGNIAYYSGLKAATKSNDFQPLVIKGLVLIQPYFGGLNRTGSELRLVEDPVLPLNVNDLMWELSLPIGSDRGHEFCDPSKRGGSSLLDRVRDLGWRVGVVASDSDPLFDRDVELVKLMKERGVSVEEMITKDDRHGAFASGETNKRKDLLDLVRKILS